MSNRVKLSLLQAIDKLDSAVIFAICCDTAKLSIRRMEQDGMTGAPIYTIFVDFMKKIDHERGKLK